MVMSLREGKPNGAPKFPCWGGCQVPRKRHTHFGKDSCETSSWKSTGISKKQSEFGTFESAIERSQRTCLTGTPHFDTTHPTGKGRHLDNLPYLLFSQSRCCCPHFCSLVSLNIGRAGQFSQSRCCCPHIPARWFL